VDVVLDTDGGDTQQRSLGMLKPGGILFSVVSRVPESTQKRYGIRAAYFYVGVTTARLNQIAELFDSGKLHTDVGTVLPLEQARSAHEMLDSSGVIPVPASNLSCRLCFREANGRDQFAGFSAYRMIDTVRRRNSHV
jgi:hypothetical protein